MSEAQKVNKMLKRLLIQKPIPSKIKARVRKQLRVDIPSIDELLADHTLIASEWAFRYVQAKGILDRAQYEFKELDATLNFTIRTGMKRDGKGGAREKDIQSKVQMQRSYIKAAGKVEDAKFLESMLRTIVELFDNRMQCLRSISKLEAIRRERKLWMSLDTRESNPRKKLVKKRKQSYRAMLGLEEE